MQYTTNLNLKKPDYTDPVDIQDINSNMDIIDASLDDKVDNSRVLTDVPSNAKFTDTIVDISGKADKTYVDGLIGDIDSALDMINGEVI